MKRRLLLKILYHFITILLFLFITISLTTIAQDNPSEKRNKEEHLEKKTMSKDETKIPLENLLIQEQEQGESPLMHNQNGIPDAAAHYSFFYSTGTYTEITGGTVSTISSTVHGENISLPFTFNYDGTDYTTGRISVSGWFEMGQTFTSYTYGNDLAHYAWNPFLAPLWDNDLRARGAPDNTEVRYETSGTSPNRIFTVQWKNICWMLSGSTVNFQVKIEETTNKIYFHYGPNNSTESRWASIGINDDVGGVGHFISVTPGSPPTTSSTTANNQISPSDYPGNGVIYTFTPPPCPSPSTQTETNITLTSVDLGWTENGSATAWDIEWGPTGFTQGSGTMITGTTTNPHSLTGLSASTTYDWYVRAQCGGGINGLWVGPSTFSTLCGSINTATLPFTERWESKNGSRFDDGLIYCSPTYRWDLETSLPEGRAQWGTNSAFNHNGNGAITLDRYPTGDYNINYAILTINLSNYSSSTDLSLSFWWFDNTDEEHTNDKVWIRGSSTNTWIEIYDLNPELVSTWQEVRDLDIDAVLSGAGQSPSASFQVRFGQEDNSYTYTNGDGIAFDDIMISEVSCPAPTNLTTSNIQLTSINLGWTEVGISSTWDIEWGPTGFIQGSGTMITGTTANPHSLTGLSAGTTYDFYVRADCGSSSYSDWEGPCTFRTAESYPFTENWETGSISSAWYTHVGSNAYMTIKTAAAHNGTYGLEQSGQNELNFTTPSSLADAYIRAQPGGTNETHTTWNKVIVDLTGATAPLLKFYYSMGFLFDNNYNNFWVQIDAGSGWVDLFSTQNSGYTIPHTRKDLDLTAYAGNVVTIRFFHNSKFSGNYLYLDDIFIVENSGGSWTGATSTDWATASNWDGGNVPNASTDVTIQSGLTNYPVVDETVACDNLKINDGGLLTVNSGSSLSVGGNLTIGGGTSGEFEMNGGTCTVTGNLYSEIGCTVDINGGTLGITNWYRSSSDAWSKGTIELSGGTINASREVVFSAYDVSGTMNGSFNLNVGETFRNNHTNWSTVTGGTITLTGTSDGTDNYCYASAFGAGNYLIAWDLVINGNSGENFWLNPNSDVTGFDIRNNLTISGGIANTKNGLYSNDDFGIDGAFTVGSNATFIHGDINTFSVGSWSLNSSSIYIYKGSNAQTIISTPTYGNLYFSGLGVKTAGGNLSIAGCFDVGYGSSVNSGSSTISFNGNWNIDGTFNYQNSSVVLNNTAKGDNILAPQNQLLYNKNVYLKTKNNDSFFSENQTIQEDNSKPLFQKDTENSLSENEDNFADQDINPKNNKFIRDINSREKLKTRNIINPKGDDPEGNQNLTGSPGTPNLTTTFASGYYGGLSNYFDISATGGVDVTINAYDVHTASTSTVSVQVWYITESYVGHTSSSSGWVQIGSTKQVTGQGRGIPTHIDPGASVTIPNGSTYGFFISCQEIRYTGGDNTYSDSYLTINCGVSCNSYTPGSGGTSNSKTWNGTIYYTYSGAPSSTFNYYDLTINSEGTITTTSDIHCYHNFTNGSEAVLDMGSNILTVDGAYTNNGEIKSENTATCPAGTDTDINGPEGSNDALTFNPLGSMGSTTVTTYSGVYHSQGTYGLKRWWDIDPTTSQTCTITLRMRNEETTNITDWATSEPWMWNGSSWSQNGTYSSHSSSGGFTTVTYTNFSITGGEASNVITLSQNDPLPVGLISFTASVNKNNVTLNWTTAWEINNAGFDIERQSLEIGKDIWEKIGFVEGCGTTNEPKNYTFPDKKLKSGKYNYRLIQRDYNNRGFEHFLSDAVTVGVPKKYALSQNYPNPFNPTTKIDYDIPFDGKVNIVLYDITGREVVTLVDKVFTAGYYTTEFNASRLASGIYLYRIIAKGGKNDFVMTKKMVLIK